MAQYHSKIKSILHVILYGLPHNTRKHLIIYDDHHFIYIDHLDKNEINFNTFFCA